MLTLFARGYLLLSIFASGGIYGVLWGPSIKLLLLIIGICGIGLLSYQNQFLWGINKFDIFFLYIIGAFSVFHSGVNLLWVEDLSSYRSLIIAFICGLFYLKIRCFNKNRIINDFYYCLLVIMWHSFVNLGLQILISDKFYPMNFETPQGFVYSTYKNIFFISSGYSTEDMDKATTIFRLNGWFWEPGVLQFYLNILLCQILFINRRNFKLLWILLPSIVATFSTTGIIIMSLIILIYWFRRKNDIKKFFIGVLISIFLIPTGGILVYNKFVDDKQRPSADARTIDTIIPILISIEHPFWGIGMGNNEAYFEQLNKRVSNSSLHDRGISNGISSSFLYLGVIIALIFWTIYVFSPFWKGNRLLLIVFLLGFIGEPIVFTIVGLIPFILSIHYIFYSKKQACAV